MYFLCYKKLYVIMRYMCYTCVIHAICVLLCLLNFVYVETLMRRVRGLQSVPQLEEMQIRV